MHSKDSRSLFHFQRPRINQLFAEAARYPLVVVCAGAGYGKTSAVHDFAEDYKAETLWLQLSERDNVGARFWENFSHAAMKLNRPFAEAIVNLGFPDSGDKFNQLFTLVYKLVDLKRRIIVLDDYHFIEEASMIHFMEKAIPKLPPGTSLFLATRSIPKINIAGLVSRGHIFNINENDLRFTETELAQYFHRLNISSPPESKRAIMQDTEGWAFAINLIARSYQNAPGYDGYLRSAMRTNIFHLMETEIWNKVSKRLQNFLIRLSLIEHLSADLILLLAGGDADLTAELERQSAYVRRDSYINAYLIHPLFLDFLSTKQEMLPEKQKRETYAIAGDWCVRNAFKIDALSYYERTGDYDSIASILYEMPAQIPENIAKYAAAIFDRAPPKAFETVEFLAMMHIRSYICQGNWQRATELADCYREKFQKLPEQNSFRNLTLGGIYYSQAYLRGLLCLSDDRYDFDVYIEKFVRYHPKPCDMEKYPNYSPGTWTVVVGVPRKGAPDEYIMALNRSYNHLLSCMSKLITGEEELARGELAFYQGKLEDAGTFFERALSLAKENKQYEIEQRALFYTMRLCFAQGDHAKAEQALKKIKAQLDENDYANRFLRYDVSLSWYFYILGQSEKIPEWLKENFSSYSHAAFIENFANQMKARYFFLIRRYPPLLTYIREMKQRESFLFGRVEMLAMEACVHYKMRDKKKAMDTLKEAHKNAAPNDLVMPFIELGKDMRTLCTVALKETGVNIPGAWLQAICRRASTYAKRQAHAAVEYRQASHISDGIALSARETEILTDLSQGLSRAEIAENRDLSINTVKMLIKNIYSKTGAENLADLIRIAVLRKLI